MKISKVSKVSSASSPCNGSKGAGAPGTNGAGSYVVHSWTAPTREFPEGRCEYRYSLYVPQLMHFNDDYYAVPPVSYLVEGYGEDWVTPKQFSYASGITDGHYANCVRF